MIKSFAILLILAAILILGSAKWTSENHEYAVDGANKIKESIKEVL